MNNYGMNIYQQFIHLSRYARWLPEESRRETWPETVSRYFNFFENHLKEYHDFTLSKKLRKELETSVLIQKVMPSMRCLMTAGEALKRENVAGYNCSFIAVDNTRVFDEILYVLMNGTGVGFSVERQFVSQLPSVAEELFSTDTTIVVADSKLGWAKSLKEFLQLLYSGQIPEWDVSRVRPAGAPLKTFGGRASGPEPLIDLFRFCIKTFQNAVGRKLTSIECHDIICKIADIVVVGGVRRSALISLSNLSDDRMRHAKSGQWYIEEGQRALANNSACYTEKPDMGIFMDEWKALYDSKSGERGIFNRAAAWKHSIRFGRRNSEHQFGTNPCGEIILRSMGFCNLTEVIIRENDTLETLKEKVLHATILGTFQSTLTNFKYLRKTWKDNAEEERLLGVSLTGIMDSKITNTSSSAPILEQLREYAVEVNKEWAEILNINPSVAITTVKPSGTVSQLTNSASGIHARHAPYYIRRVRADKKDPLSKMMKDAGFYCEDDIMKPSHQWVFSFPQKSPTTAITRTEMSALNQLENWKTYRDNWTEHNPSCTISVKENEWMDVGAWVYEHFDEIGGLSFLPYTDTNYRQMPYEDCTEIEYNELLEKTPKEINWSKLSIYEKTDETRGSQELACTADVCEIVDIVSGENPPELVHH